MNSVVIASQSSVLLFAGFLGHLLSRNMITTLWQKYNSDFPGKRVQPIQKLFGEFKRLSDGLVMNWNELSIFRLLFANFESESCDI